MTAREYETIAVWPGRILRVVPHDTGKQDIRKRRQRHRRAGMPGVRLLDGVH